MCCCRGPAYGYKGKVLLAFEENGFSKIGVRFDRSIPEGNDLGGLCEEDHGFFCAGTSLLLDILHASLYFVACLLRVIDFISLVEFGSACTADFLRLDNSSIDDLDKLAINELFEVCAIYLACILGCIQSYLSLEGF